MSLDSEIIALENLNLEPVVPELIVPELIVPELENVQTEPIMECKFLGEDIDATNIVKYRINKDDEWQVLDYCSDCVVSMLDQMWKTYITSLKNETCKKALRNLVKIGPPIKFRDTQIESNAQLYEFYYNNSIQSSYTISSFDPDTNLLFWTKLKTQLLPLLETDNAQIQNDIEEIEDPTSLDHTTVLAKIYSEFGI
jgi:hypothetical protein